MNKQAAQKKIEELESLSHYDLMSKAGVVGSGPRNAGLTQIARYITTEVLQAYLELDNID